MIKLHMTEQSGPVILVIICHSHWSFQGGINDTYYENLWSDATKGTCVCVVIPFILNVRLEDAPARVTQQEKVYTGFLHLPSAALALIFIAREGFSHLFPSSTVKPNFVYPWNNRSLLVGHGVRENPSSCDCAEIRSHVPTSEGFEVNNWTTGATSSTIRGTPILVVVVGRQQMLLWTSYSSWRRWALEDSK